VVGLVASRLAERHHRPVVVVSVDEQGNGRGSGRSIPGFDLLAALEACSEHLTRFGGHRAAAGLELRAECIDAFREAFAHHAGEALGPADLVRTERIDAMVGGSHLGLDLAEELGRLAPFGMGNPGVRLLVPSATVRDVRPIGEGRHARFNLHSGAHRALGVAFGRSRLPVAEDEPVDAAIRLEVNRWNGSVEPRVVLRELYAHDSDPAALESDASAPWWERFEEELASDPSGPPPIEGPERLESRRTRARGGGSAAATVAELASSGAAVLALVCEAHGRSGLARSGAQLSEHCELEMRAGLASEYHHVVLVDPPAFPHIERLAELPSPGGGFLHLAWGDSEWRLAMASLARRLARRPALVAAYRDLRDAGEAGGEALLAALRGSSARPRDPQTAARCFRVLGELGLIQGRPESGHGSVRVVSSDETDLERSAAFRAYGARYEEGRRFLERRRHP
jgi:single-stranded-DNA-specific exonuclease